METCAARSTSSIWGSAVSHVHGLSRRLAWNTESEPESRVTMEIDQSKSGQSAQITGSRNVICKTTAECKANKLNRNEQTKLEGITIRVVKEQEIARRKFRQSERMLRARSAKIGARIQTLESSSYVADKPIAYAYEKRPKSEQISRRTRPAAIQGTSKTDAKAAGRCKMCEKIQQVIQVYEKAGRKTGILAENDAHSTCLFSDVQMRTFICMLEAKYFSDIPDLNNKLRESGVVSRDLTRNGTKWSRNEINNTISKRNIELRIQQFCTELEFYKKTRDGIAIPKEVQDDAERIRMKNAVLTVRQIPSKQQLIKKEAEEFLRL